VSGSITRVELLFSSMYLLRRAVYLRYVLDVIAWCVVTSKCDVECYYDIPVESWKGYSQHVLFTLFILLWDYYFIEGSEV
jgi:hypothetical protein